MTFFVIIDFMDTMRLWIINWLKHRGNGHHLKSIAKLFFALWIPFVLIVTGIFVGIIHIDTKLELNTLATHEVAQTELAAQLIANKIRLASMDIDLYARSPTLRIYASTGKITERNRFLLAAKNVINEKPIYQNIAYLDKNGIVDMYIENIGNTATVFNPLPSNIATLHNLYLKTINQIDNETTVIDTFSQLKSRQPNDPILYLSKVIQGQNGEKNTVIIFGLNKSELTKNTINMLSNHADISIMNTDGLTINQPDQMNPLLTKAIQHDQANEESNWNKILKNAQGSISDNDAIIAFSTLNPLSAVKPSLHASAGETLINEKPWKIISYIPPEKTPDATFTRYPHLFILYLICVALVSILAGFMTKIIFNRRQVSKQLAATAIEMQDLYENAPCGYHSLDKHGKIIRINSTELSWLGYTRKEIVGKKKFTDFLTPESQQRFEYNFKHLITHGSLHDIEYELVCKNDQRIDIILNSTAIYNAKGQYIQSRTTLHNITARKQMERALKESEERSRNIMEFAPIGMAIISLSDKIIHANKQLCEMLGFGKGELQHITLSQLTHPADLEHITQRLNEMMNNNLPFLKHEMRYICKNGELVWAQVTTTLMRDNVSNQPLYFISQFENITERKLYAEKIHQLAYHDSLTNLPNRQQLKEKLNHILAHAERHHECFAIFFIDVDNFKHVNDTYGHDAGDDLLKQIASRLKSNVRATDIVARPGGDEFVIVLTSINDLRYIHSIADKIQHALNQPLIIQDKPYIATCSIGIARYPVDGTTMTELVKRADIAMYGAKTAGKNQHQLYQEKAVIDDIHN